jgi:6-phospho-beta-glucosidase
MTGNAKIAVLGGGGVRTPLLIHGLAHAQAELGFTELALYDVDHSRAVLMGALGNEIVKDRGIRIITPEKIEAAIDGSKFVVSSIRVGGIEARARDERIALEHGYAGQETTGPAGFAMALRTVPVAVEHARLVERHAAGAWLISFTNPAGLITQAVMQHTGVRIIGICDTPSELFHRIAWALGEPFEYMTFDYAGLNHLGWVRKIGLRGEDITDRLLIDPLTLGRVYPGDLFDPALIRVLHLIPAEYVFFYYSRRKAFQNLNTAGASRGEEIQRLNAGLISALQAEVRAGRYHLALEQYKQYLNQRNASYMRLEAHAESAFEQEEEHNWNPFEGATGYHRIAVDVMTALSGDARQRVVVNVRNGTTIDDLAPDDVIEVPCEIDRFGPRPLPVGRLPKTIQGLVTAVKEFERLTIRAALEKSFDLARLALLANPIVGEWEPSTELVMSLVKSDPQHLGYLSQ